MTSRPDLRPWAFVAFPLVILFLFTLLPTILGIGLSFFEWSGGHPPRFIGLRHYASALRDPALLHALRNTLLFTLATVPLTVILAFLIALALNAPWMPGRTLARTLYFLPTVISVVAVGFIWRWILNPQNGLLNLLLLSLGVPRDSLPDWLGNSPLGLSTLAAVSIWRNLGFSVIIYLAALSELPRSLYDAAAVDGAGPWRSAWTVAWPGVRPITAFLLITGAIGSLQVFDIILVMIGTVSQPWTDVLNLALYREFNAVRLGYAAFIGVLILTLTLLVTAAQFAWLKRRGAIA